ncbi:PGPGW domain-containing protein [Thalassospira sp. TSL5-1]|uniref:PGPGW domain-containing protein n=1 Tax=Thalassospira sp. TSL5-1 TaxID=1544451 RepID=UPI00143AD69F|nr:PGPGW domain-containing protein [Thalassospira sp. TSL5-1]
MRLLRSFGLVGGGLVLLLVGLAFLPLPPPFFGMVLIAFAIPMLASGSKRARRLIQFARWKIAQRNGVLEKALYQAPRWIGVYLRKTDPGPVTRRLRQRELHQRSLT